MRNSQLFSTKPFKQLMLHANEDNAMKRALSATNLTTLGIGAVIGAGIFVLTGQAAAQYAGPGIVISFLISGLACLFAGLCYAEFASMIPISGSAYTYAYAPWESSSHGLSAGILFWNTCLPLQQFQ
jgi:APA family basic amino acid/polyamine antiporter